MEGAVYSLTNGAATADCTVRLYGDPLGTPTALATIDANSYYGPGNVGARGLQYGVVTTPVTLYPGVDYCLAFEALGSGNLILSKVVLQSAAHRAVLGIDNQRKGSRTDLTGAFTETTTEIPYCGIIISHIDNGLGQGVASLNVGI
jgi:hypothetical protein